MIRFVKLYYKIIVWVLIMAYLSFANGNDFNKVHINIPYLDKIVHFGMFFILGVLVSSINYVNNTRVLGFLLPIIAVIYGGAIEIIQQFFIATRNGDIFDWLADILGLVVGVLIFAYLPKSIKHLFVA